MKTETIHIGGMTCVNCQNRIEKKLKSTVGVEDATVNYSTGTATVTWNPSVVTFNEIKAAVETLDYTVLKEPVPDAVAPVTEIIGTLVIILSLYVLLRGLGISTISSAFPLAEAGMGYGMLFVIGLITSVHCIAMCGGINLSQTLGGGSLPLAPTLRVSATPSPGGSTPKPLFNPAVLFPSVLYNAGRVISYTTVGIIVGALGSVITISGRFQGIVQLAAGVFMVIMGINMLGIFQGAVGTFLRRFNLSMPKIFAKKIDEQKAGNKNPLIIGLLNGLMPCGPLQAMQLYALSTGSPIAGGISMFLFSMGTVPLMFGIGALGSVLSKKFSHRVMKVGAILVTVMGMTMFTYGWGLSGFSFDFVDKAVAAINPIASKTGGDGAFAPVIENGVQIVNSTLSGGRYPAITVQAGIPVKWTINAPQGSINGCNNRMIVREYGIEHSFSPGENLVEFTPTKTGKFSYSCWMGMIRSSITVVEEGQSIADIGEPSLNPTPAGVAIPTDKVSLAEIRDEGYQTITINLHDEGIDPAIIVLQQGIPTVWTINNNSLDPGNSSLIFPAYYAELEIEQGDNVIQLLPTDDFDFSTGDNVFYGYVKVVEDLNNIDIEAIKAEVGNFETMIYPDAYFEAVAQAGGCCGGAEA
ncbi:heavy metal-associated domain-containing protein [Spirochaetia bacterium]|nr:heavy metal-associated domain-containing protein [Spirochaetia bacterium]GHU31562.1 heavy metal-associated domain-containing protein [Spirochaetia bacterium]